MKKLVYIFLIVFVSSCASTTPEISVSAYKTCAISCGRKNLRGVKTRWIPLVRRIFGENNLNICRCRDNKQIYLEFIDPDDQNGKELNEDDEFIWEP